MGFNRLCWSFLHTFIHYLLFTGSIQLQSRSTGQRNKAHLKDLGCPVRIIWSVRTDGMAKLNQLVRDHNHSTSKAFFKADTMKLDDEDIKLIKPMVCGNCRPRQVKMMLEKQMKKAIGLETKEELDIYLRAVVELGGTVCVKEDKNEVLVVLFIATAEMKKPYVGAAPLPQLQTRQTRTSSSSSPANTRWKESTETQTRGRLGKRWCTTVSSQVRTILCVVSGRNVLIYQNCM